MTDAADAARLFAQAPLGTGLHLRARPGPARDRFLAALRGALPGTAWRTCPPGITDDRLLGGLDLAATLAGGRPVVRPGLLADTDGGIVVVSGAERIGPGLAARLGAVLDDGEVRAERDGAALHHAARIGLLLLDEGEEEEVPPSLRDRLAFRVELADEVIDGFDCGAGQPDAPPGVHDTLVQVAAALGIGSTRAVLLALRAARSAAVGAGRDIVSPEDTALAARLVLAHRATRLPPQDDAPPQPEEQPESDGGTGAEDEDEDGQGGNDATAVLAAIRAVLPDKLLAVDAGATGTNGSGRAAGRDRIAPRGRPAGSRPGRPGGDARLHLVATLMAAAPRQRLRPRRPGTRLAFRAADLRLRLCHARPRQTTLFVVDASGSAALHRLAEAKGAVELLLGECYVTRNQVGLIAFRGTAAELLLPPTRALARARRCLGALPGGGGTPLAAGLAAAGEMADRLRRRGEAPLLVVLTDGRGNVALDGTADRARAGTDAIAAAARLRAAKLPGLVLDISPRPAREAGALAAAMGARYLPLPRADAASLTRAVKDAA